MVLPQIGKPLIVGVLARLVAGLVPRQVERPDRPLVDVDPALHQHLGELVVAVGQGEVEAGGAEVLHALDPVHGEAGVDLEEEAGDAGVDEGVADDEDVEEGLACRKCEIRLIYFLLGKKSGIKMSNRARRGIASSSRLRGLPRGGVGRTCPSCSFSRLRPG